MWYSQTEVAIEVLIVTTVALAWEKYLMMIFEGVANPNVLGLAIRVRKSGGTNTQLGTATPPRDIEACRAVPNHFHTSPKDVGTLCWVIGLPWLKVRPTLTGYGG